MNSSQPLATGKYRCTEVQVYPAECGEQLGRDPSEIGSSKSLVKGLFSRGLGGREHFGTRPCQSPSRFGIRLHFLRPLPLPKAYHLCAKANSPSFSEKSPSLPQNSVSSLFRKRALETAFRPFPKIDGKRTLRLDMLNQGWMTLIERLYGRKSPGFGK